MKNEIMSLLGNGSLTRPSYLHRELAIRAAIASDEEAVVVKHIVSNIVTLSALEDCVTKMVPSAEGRVKAIVDAYAMKNVIDIVGNRR